MTEDEAFVRRIVHSPGDDLSRRVYADWLDDRGDPRGAYLRAELEWAKAKQTAGFMVLRLNGLAEGLDSVWVARVSRPPVGVCCDHIRFTESGPRQSIVDVENLQVRLELEARLPLRFPTEFTAFLVNYNGGLVTPAARDSSGSDWSECEVVPHGFYAVGHQTRRQLNFEWAWHRHGGELPPGRARDYAALAPLAWADWDHHLFIGVGDEHFGKVYYGYDRLGLSNLVIRADTLPQFLVTVTAHWARG